MSVSGNAFDLLFQDESFIARCQVLMAEAMKDILVATPTDEEIALSIRITTDPRAAFMAIGRTALTDAALQTDYETPTSMADADIKSAFADVLPSFATGNLTF